MIRSAAFLSQSTGGVLLPGAHGGDTLFDTVSIDTRTLKDQAAFFCLRGPHFDAHDFIEQAADAAAIIVIDKERQDLVSQEILNRVAVITVDNPEEALAQSAAAWRALHTLTVVGLTGSSGKTTTKEFIAASLATLGPTVATVGNLNNHLGVPLTLFRIRPEHRFAVIEMGMNAFGEIDFLTRLARPSIGVVTSVGQAHTEGVGSIRGVAQAKGELLRALPSDSIAFFPSHVAERIHLTKDMSAEARTIGYESGDDVRLEACVEGPDGAHCIVHVAEQPHELLLKLSGRHNLENAALALAVGLHCGGDVKVLTHALAEVEPPKFRGEKRRLMSGVEVVLDCYNANPQSMRAAVSTFVSRHPNGVLALGDMLELGDTAIDEHRTLGHFVAQSAQNIDLLGVGQLSKHLVEAAMQGGLGRSQVSWAEKAASGVGFISERCARGRAVLLKGSRGMKLETIWDAISQSEGV